MRRQVRRQERVQREIEIARQIQRSLLPMRCLAFPGLELAGECRPAAQVGGDYYGFRTCGDDRLAATVFDVAGHGIGAAFCMTLVRSALHGELARGGDPSEVLTRANALVWEDLAESGLYATAFLARFDRRRGILDYASAGHARPIHWSSQRHAFVDRPEGGLPLGMFADSEFPAGVAAFSPDDLLVLYTDGIVEAVDGAGLEFGRDRLMGAVHRLRRRTPAVVLRQLWRALEAFTGGRGLRDDATLVVVRGARGFGQAEERPRGRRMASGMAAHLPMFARLGRAAGRALSLAGTNLRRSDGRGAGGFKGA